MEPDSVGVQREALRAALNVAWPVLHDLATGSGPLRQEERDACDSAVEAMCEVLASDAAPSPEPPVFDMDDEGYCIACGGDGECAQDDGERTTHQGTCPSCLGAGRIVPARAAPEGGTVSTPCENCDGDGWVEMFVDPGYTVLANTECWVCGGSGVDVSVQREEGTP